MKILTKRKSLMGFIYALIMLLPFSAILVRSLYVVINKNAYESYSGANESEVTSTYLTSTSQIDSDSYYYFDLHKFQQSTSTTYYNAYVKNIEIVYQGNLSDSNAVLLTTNEHIRLSISPQGTSDNLVGVYKVVNGVNTWIMNINVTNTYVLFKAQIERTDNVVILNMFYYETINEQYYLDNAFDYSLYTFLNENGSGRLNLTDWFTDIFLNRTTHNMLYLNYINWYMNYSLLVSCVYLLYSVLMWFLTFARTLLNKPLKECD